MSRFNIVNYTPATADGKDLDVFKGRYKNMRFNMAAERTIKLTVADEFNLPGLAFKYLGDKGLWWVLLQFNGLTDPINDIRAGTVLRVPSRSDVISYLETVSETTTIVTL